MNEKKNETTAEHFDIFKAECKKWIDWFSLNDWFVVFKHGECEGSSFAEVWTKAIGRVAGMVLNTDWEDIEVTTEQVRRSAFHECAELWLRNIVSLGEARTYYENEMEKETHRLIRLLENRVWEKF